MYAIFNALLRICKYLIDSVLFHPFLFNFEFHNDTNTYWSKKARECDDVYIFHVSFQKIKVC